MPYNVVSEIYRVQIPLVEEVLNIVILSLTLILCKPSEKYQKSF